jgi:type II secretory pathway component PulF
MTAVLYGFAHVMRTFWYVHVALPLIAIGVAKKCLATSKERFTMNDTLLTLPILSEVLHKIALARFAKTINTLLSSAVPRAFRPSKSSRQPQGMQCWQTLSQDAAAILNAL